MYELLLELPWRKEKFTKEEWVKGYVKARYGTEDPMLLKAWEIMAATAYNCPEIRQGTTESVFCARPGETIRSVSSWGSAQMFYNARDFREAAECMLQVAEKYEGNNNFEYDLIDVVRQTLVDYGNGLQKEMVEAFKAGDKSSFGQKSREFLALILLQDSLLSTRPEFMVGPWLEQAKKIGADEKAKELYEWNARTQITVWGNKHAADKGGLRDYAHREWAGLLRDFYYPRWEAWIGNMQARLDGEEMPAIDWYEQENPWTLERKNYPVKTQAAPVPTAKAIFRKVFPKTKSGM